MTRSPDSLIPSGAGQPATEKLDDCSPEVKSVTNQNEARSLLVRRDGEEDGGTLRKHIRIS